MPSATVCKTVRQYSSGPIPGEHMQKLLEVAGDYSKVKNYVYARFGSIGSLSKLYPGYTVQNEMTESGLRDSLGLPSVYFYLAVFDALGDIRAQWGRTKSRILKLVGQNQGFTEEDKHYLRFLLKVSNAFEQVLNNKPLELPGSIQAQCIRLSAKVDTEKLHRYLRRQVRKHHARLHTEGTLGFSIAERAYRYGDHGIYISVKEKRKRVFVPLTDNNQYTSQLSIQLYPEEGRLEIRVPLRMKIRKNTDYTREIGVAFGMYTMLTTHEGKCYGEQLGDYQIAYAKWLREQARVYSQNKESNPGRKKYDAKKQRLREQLHGYINQELNRFLREEKPQIIYMAKLPWVSKRGINREINDSVNLWQRGYIRKRLAQKCEEQSIKLAEVFGKDISRECSFCGAIGTKTKEDFFCSACGYRDKEKTNTARNVKKRGEGGGKLKGS